MITVIALQNCRGAFYRTTRFTIHQPLFRVLTLLFRNRINNIYITKFSIAANNVIIENIGFEREEEVNSIIKKASRDV